MKRKQPEDDYEFHVGSKNVFADLGLPDADELLIKADLASEINAVIDGKGWKQAETSQNTGLTQPEVSRLRQMKTDGFSQHRLQTVLIRLGIDVEIRLTTRKKGGAGFMRVSRR